MESRVELTSDESPEGMARGDGQSTAGTGIEESMQSMAISGDEMTFEEEVIEWFKSVIEVIEQKKSLELDLIRMRNSMKKIVDIIYAYETTLNGMRLSKILDQKKVLQPNGPEFEKMKPLVEMKGDLEQWENVFEFLKDLAKMVDEKHELAEIETKLKDAEWFESMDTTEEELNK